MTQHVNPTTAGRPDRRRRRFLPLLLAAWMVLEIWVMIQVATATTWLLVLVLLLLGLVVGFRLIKRAGLDAVRAATAGTPFERGSGSAGGSPAEGGSTGERRPPSGNAGLLALAGLLLAVPGFLSDLLGLTVLFPPTRGLWRGPAAGWPVVPRARRRSATRSPTRCGCRSRCGSTAPTARWSRARWSIRPTTPPALGVRRTTTRARRSTADRVWHNARGPDPNGSGPLALWDQALLRVSRGCTARFIPPERSTASRSASTSSSSSRVRRSISMSQWVRVGLVFFSSGSSPSSRTASVPQNRHSQTEGISASTEKGTSNRCPF